MLGRIRKEPETRYRQLEEGHAHHVVAKSSAKLLVEFTINSEAGRVAKSISKHGVKGVAIFFLLLIVTRVRKDIN